MNLQLILRILESVMQIVVILHVKVDKSKSLMLQGCLHLHTIVVFLIVIVRLVNFCGGDQQRVIRLVLKVNKEFMVDLYEIILRQAPATLPSWVLELNNNFKEKRRKKKLELVINGYLFPLALITIKTRAFALALWGCF